MAICAVTLGAICLLRERDIFSLEFKCVITALCYANEQSVAIYLDMLGA